MTNAEFLEKLAKFRSELEEEVIHQYQQYEKDLGDLSWNRWSERFHTFLQDTVPKEGRRWKDLIDRSGFAAAIAGGPVRGTAIDRFMRVHGNKTLAFIENLETEIKKGRLDFSNVSLETEQEPPIYKSRAYTSPNSVPPHVTHQTNNVYNAPVGSVQQGNQNSAHISQASGSADSKETPESGYRWWLKIVIVPIVAVLLTGLFVVLGSLVSNSSKSGGPLNSNVTSSTDQSVASTQTTKSVDGEYSESGLSQRIALRSGLRSLTVAESGRLASKLPSGIYGFSGSSIFEWKDAEIHRVPPYGRISFEAHKTAQGQLLVLAFVNLDTQRTLALNPRVSVPVTLYSDSWDEAKFGVLVLANSCNGASRVVKLDDGSQVDAVDCDPNRR